MKWGGKLGETKRKGTIDGAKNERSAQNKEQEEGMRKDGKRRRKCTTENKTRGPREKRG